MNFNLNIQKLLELLLISLVVVFLVTQLKSCSKPEEQPEIFRRVETKYIHHTDTVKVWDTIKSVIFKSVPVIVKVNDSIRSYTYKLDEKDLSGSLEVLSTGVVKDYNLNYSILKTFVHTYDTILTTIHDSVVYKIPEEKKVKFLLGGETYVSSTKIKGLGINISVQDRRDYIYYTGYSYQFNAPGYIVIGMKIPIIPRKNKK